MLPQDARLARVIKKLAHFRKEERTLKAMQRRMASTGETQVSLTEPDCRAMATTRKQRVVGYNVQTVVETKHHLIVAHEVTNHGYDRDALSMMARAPKDVMARGDRSRRSPTRATTVVKRSSPPKRPASPSRSRSRTHQTRGPWAASTKPILSASSLFGVGDAIGSARCRSYVPIPLFDQRPSLRPDLPLP
jgi:hypothetical protein